MFEIERYLRYYVVCIYMEQGRVLLSYGSVGGVGKTVLQTARLIQSNTL